MNSGCRTMGMTKSFKKTTTTTCGGGGAGGSGNTSSMMSLADSFHMSLTILNTDYLLNKYEQQPQPSSNSTGTTDGICCSHDASFASFGGSNLEDSYPSTEVDDSSSQDDDGDDAFEEESSSSSSLSSSASSGLQYTPDGIQLITQQSSISTTPSLLFHKNNHEESESSIDDQFNESCTFPFTQFSSNTINKSNRNRSSSIGSSSTKSSNTTTYTRNKKNINNKNLSSSSLLQESFQTSFALDESLGSSFAVYPDNNNSINRTIYTNQYGVCDEEDDEDEEEESDNDSCNNDNDNFDLEIDDDDDDEVIEKNCALLDLFEMENEDDDAHLSNDVMKDYCTNNNNNNSNSNNNNSNCEEDSSSSTFQSDSYSVVNSSNSSSFSGSSYSSLDSSLNDVRSVYYENSLFPSMEEDEEYSGDGDDHTNNDTSTITGNPGGVRFGYVQVREYSVTVGSCSAVKDPCPIQLDWMHSKRDHYFDVSAHVMMSSRNRRLKQQTLASSYYKKNQSQQHQQHQQHQHQQQQSYDAVPVRRLSIDERRQRIVTVQGITFQQLMDMECKNIASFFEELNRRKEKEDTKNLVLQQQQQQQKKYNII